MAVPKRTELLSGGYDRRSLFEVSPHLLVYRRRIDGVAEVVADVTAGQAPVVIDDPRLLWALSNLHGSFTRASILARWATEPRVEHVAEQLWAYLAAEGLIVEALDRPPWYGNAPDYHHATRSFPFLDMSRASAFAVDNSVMRRYAEESEPPPLYAEFDSLERIHLSTAPEILAAAPSPVDLRAALPILFDGVFGERMRIAPYIDEPSGYIQLELAFKSIPSGGARHPTECFAYLNVPGVAAGVYHYSVGSNSLDLLLREASDAVDTWGPAFQHVRSSPRGGIAFMLASRAERAMWRYRDPRSFRAIVLDVGHAEAQLASFAAALGLVTDRWTSFDAEAAMSAINIDVTQYPLLGVLTAVA